MPYIPSVAKRLATDINDFGINQSRFLGRGCDEALFSEKKGFSVKRGEAIQ